MVCRDLPQTAPIAEWVAAQMTLQFAARPTTLVSDCLNVVRGIARALQNLLVFRDYRLRQSGFVKSMVLDPKWRLLQQIVKVKAHTADQADDDEELRTAKQGNRLADLAAKEAVSTSTTGSPSRPGPRSFAKL